MPDFENALKARLGRLRLASQVAEDVFAELAEHLEDVYKSHLAAGIVSEEAEIRTWREIPDGRELARKIQLAKQGEEHMNNRTRQFWLPALGTSLLGTGLLALLQDGGLSPMILHTPVAQFTPLYLPWILSLPVFGFAGAYWSRRAGGAIPTRLFAGTFLSLIYFAVPWLFVPIAMIVDHETPHMAPMGWFFLNWAILPGLALLIGALPAALWTQKSLGLSQGAIRQ